MPALSIVCDWRDGAIAAVTVDANLPEPSAVLRGRTPDEALGLLGRLYAVCGHAQRACAELALTAAGAIAPGATRRAALAEAVARECATEHLWRLLLDWPKKLGVPGEAAGFASWYRRLVTDAGPWAGDLAEALAGGWLDGAPADLEAWGTLADFDRWVAAGRAPWAVLFAALRAAEAGCAATPATGGGLAAGETGACTQHAEHAWLTALLGAGRGLEARVAGRVVGLVRLVAALVGADGADQELDVDAGSPAARCGRAAIATARGVLVHDLTLDAGGRIASYAIRTPTEANFRHGGAYATLLAGRPARDAGAAGRLADLWALALDPCVAYAVRGSAIEGAGRSPDA